MSAGPAAIPQLRADLIARLDKVDHEITMASLHRQIFTEMRDEIISRHPATDATFLNSYANVYARAQVMTIRRLADDHDDKPDSLYWIIRRIRSNPSIASRRALADEVTAARSDDPELVAMITTDYVRRWGDEVPRDDVLAELQRSLTEELEAVTTFADRNVAHNDPRGKRHSVTYAEIHAALDHIGVIANQVNSMVRATIKSYELVAIQGDWHEAFRPSLFPLSPSIYEYPDPRGFT